MNTITLNYSNKEDLELLLKLAERIGIFPSDKNENVANNSVQKDINSTPIEIIPFNPKKYYGILSPLKLNIEQELLNMRNEWKRNF